MASIETLTYDDGRTVHRVRFRHGISPKTGLPMQTAETFNDLRSAERFRKLVDALGPREALNRLYAEQVAAETPTLDTVAADHIRLLTGIEDGTRLGYTRLWDRTWSPLLGHLYADTLTADHIREGINELAQRYSSKSLANQRGLLAGVVSRCIELGYLTRNPAKSIRLPEGRRYNLDEDSEDDSEIVAITHAEWDHLHDQVDAHYKPFVRFLVGTGARWGEAVVLRKLDVDLDAGTVRIRRALKWSGDGNRLIGPPKTKKGRRTITLPPEVIADLRPLLAGKAGKDLVFTAPRGGMIAHRTFWSKNWKPALWRAQHCADHVDDGCKCGTGEPQRCALHKKTGPPPPCGCPGTLGQTPRIHDLRHTHASWLLAGRVPIHVVQARLGHESIQTTVDTYSHLMPDAQLLAAEAASQAFGTPAVTGPRPIDLAAYNDTQLAALAVQVLEEASRRGDHVASLVTPPDRGLTQSADNTVFAS